MAQDIRVLVAIDFGTTNSGFAFVHKEGNPDNIETNNSWPGSEGEFKTPTALLYYDKTYTEVEEWGDSALEDPGITDEPEETRPRPVELFKLHISNLNKDQKPWLPEQLDFKKAIEDYLTQMKQLIKDTLKTRWPGVEFPLQVGFVLTIPAEWPHHTTAIMRKCAFNAGLITTLFSNNLEFTTEPEAAALYCLNIVREHNLLPGDSFLVADCGGGTVDVTSRKLLQDDKLGEITVRAGDLCGSTFVDKEFLRWLGRKVGIQALEKLRTFHYGQMQHLVQKFFCDLVKRKFKGDPEKFKTVRLNLYSYCRDLPKYVTGDHKIQLERTGWMIKLDFDSVKGMFDPVVDRVIKLIGDQLDQLNDSSEKCSAMFLVGGFSGSPYLLSRVREVFIDRVPNISVPALPIAAVVRGAIKYGLNVEVIKQRVLKWTYGIEVCRDWVEGDEEGRRTPDGKIFYFHRMARRRTQVEVIREFPSMCYPVRPDQTSALFKIYYTSKDSATFCTNESGVGLLGTLRIGMPDIEHGRNRPIKFSLTFANMEIKAKAVNTLNGKIYEITFDLDI